MPLVWFTDILTDIAGSSLKSSVDSERQRQKDPWQTLTEWCHHSLICLLWITVVLTMNSDGLFGCSECSVTLRSPSSSQTIPKFTQWALAPLKFQAFFKFPPVDKPVSFPKKYCTKVFQTTSSWQLLKNSLNWNEITRFTQLITISSLSPSREPWRWTTSLLGLFAWELGWGNKSMP